MSHIAFPVVHLSKFKSSAGELLQLAGWAAQKNLILFEVFMANIKP